MSAPLTDSHCHLSMSADGAEPLLAAAREAGVRGFVVPGTHLRDSEESAELAVRHADVWAAVGFHPHEAKDCDETALSRIRELARGEKVVAIGEIGLDYHYMHSPREVQLEVLRRHFAIARELDLPVIIHDRESTDDLIELLESPDAAGVGGVLHSWTGSLEVARRLIDRGFFISFSGIVTFRSAEPLREVARRLPPESVLIETDTPYLAPVPHRGRPNQPAFVVEIAKLLGRLWSLPHDEVARITTANFERAFGVKIAP
ncbi:MAG TPA: TatD family hydrolase [Thermoanaerobaculia bacterium]|nr:TatD family hydrolase [Thermoanaerobaculia bacterium]